MFKEFWQKNFKGDRMIWIIYFSLLLISVVEVYSATSSLAYGKVFNGNYNGPIIKHIVHCLLGVAAAFIVHYINFRRVAKIIVFAIWPFCLAWVFLVSLTGDATNGAARWGSVPIIGNMQPSEILKMAFVVTIAYCFSFFADRSQKRLRYIVIFVTLSTAGIIFLENFSNALLVTTTALLIWTLAYNKLKAMLITIAVIVGSLFIAFTFVHTEAFKDTKRFMAKQDIGRMSTVLARFERFADAKEPGDEGFVIDDHNFQAVHGKIAIANSKGIGLIPGNSKERDYLPQAYSDFIYAIIVEEMGILGGFMVIMFYMLLLYRVGRIIAQCKTKFCAITAAGLGLMLVLQALINTSVAVGLIPVTGQPLPLISRGGSSALVISIYFGILLSISRYECEENENENNKKEQDLEPA